MDIARPDFKEKKKRRKIGVAGAAVIVAITVLVAWRPELRHHRKYVILTHDGRTLQALIDLPARPQGETVVVVLVLSSSRPICSALMVPKAAAMVASPTETQ